MLDPQEIEIECAILAAIVCSDKIYVPITQIRSYVTVKLSICQFKLSAGLIHIQLDARILESFG